MCLLKWLRFFCKIVMDLAIKKLVLIEITINSLILSELLKKIVLK